jgi:hypothetical protein
MSSFYLLPTGSFTNPLGNQFTAPKYYDTDLAGLPFAFIPFGVEGCGLLSLDQPNPNLSGRDRCLFVSIRLNPDLGSVHRLDNNRPEQSQSKYSGVVDASNDDLRTGSPADRPDFPGGGGTQYAEGPAGTNGASIFVQVSLGGNSTPSAALQALPAGVFDFTQVDPTAAVEDTIKEDAGILSVFRAPNTSACHRPFLAGSRVTYRHGRWVS